MILIDALYINTGGGKVLLDYLIESLEKSDLEIFYLLDKRIINKCPKIKSGNIKEFNDASIFNRLTFYRKHRNDYTHVLCFGNLPPNLNLKAQVYTYFHNPLFVAIPSSIPFKTRLLLLSKIKLLNAQKQNTNYFIVQSEFMKSGLMNRYNLIHDKVKIIPFYPPLEAIVPSVERIKNTFVYVSSGTNHKNHALLISAFCSFYDQFKTGQLFVTVEQRFEETYQLIQKAIDLKYPIINIGFVDRTKLSELYQKSEYLIFPSLAESFGLGLIEAIDLGCKVLGADLPYTYEVCKPSLAFNPTSKKEIENVFERAVNEELMPTIPLIQNDIKKLMQLFEN